MRKHVFLCGLSHDQRSVAPRGTTLSLAEDGGNLRLRLDQMRTRLLGSEPERLTDFIEIASYVFAADRTTSRGPLTDPGVGARWRRDFHIVAAVRDLTFWQQQSVKETLAEALNFLSEDSWRFEFVENRNPNSWQDYLELRQQDVEAPGGTTIVLFSGGIDSLAGAVDELRRTNRHVVLVSHRNLSGVGERQRQLAQRLLEAYPQRVSHVWVDNSLTGKLSDVERTQRTRSFFFTAMAAVAAHLGSADRIRFYENGVMSVNLPIATQVVGARSSRSTHPRSLQLLSRVVAALALHPISIDNPFLWKTKSELVQELASSPHADLITISVSCTRARTANRRYQPHCGACVQCLQRRIATLAGGAAALDEGDGYEVDFLRAPQTDTRDRAMAIGTVSLALECAAISPRDFLARFAGPVSWILQAFEPGRHEAVAGQLVDLFHRYGAEVRKLLIEVARPALPDVVDRILPPESLLALVLASRLSESGPTPSDPSRPRVLEPEREDVPSDDIVIADDANRKSILIRDLPELRGTAIYFIMSHLMKASLEDRSEPRLPQNYRSFRAREIADQLGFDDEESVRSAVRRARGALKDAASALGVPLDPNAVIESTGAGYRLNPKVIIGKLEDISGRKSRRVT